MDGATAKGRWWLPAPSPPSTWGSEFGTWWGQSWPTGLSILFRNAQPLSDLIFLGHLGTEQLAAASVANLLVVLTSGWVWKGFGGAINTLGSQSVGAGNPKLAGTWYAMSLWMAFVIDCAIACVWYVAAGPIFATARFTPTTASLATLYCRWFILYVFPSHAFIMTTNYLQSLGVVKPVLAINAAAAGVNVLLNYLLVMRPQGLGFQGSPIATAITTWMTLIAVAVYMHVSGVARGSWHWPNPEAFSRVRIMTMLKQAVPGAFGNFVEDLQIVVLSFLAARLDSASIATHNGTLNLFFVLSCLMYGSVRASIVRIGFHLGRRDVPTAKAVACMHLGVTGGVGAVVACLFLTMRRFMGRIFSTDPEVIALASQIAVPVGAGYAALALFFVSMGVLQGQGRPGVVALAFLVGAWAVAVPVAFTFVDHGYGLVGIWYALVCGYGTITLIAVAAVLASNWDAAVKAAVARTARLGTHPSSPSMAATAAREAGSGSINAPLLSAHAHDVATPVDVWPEEDATPTPLATLKREPMIGGGVVG